MTTIEPFGKFTVLEELGHGAFATVYRARDTVLSREVALKVLHPQLIADPEFVRRFYNDARAVARLEHPNIVTVYELLELNQRLTIVMQYLSGGSLADLLKQKGQVPFKLAYAVIAQIAAALDYTHARNFIHRDIKPNNILFRSDGQAVLTDFGLVRAVEQSVVALTSMGGIMGTPAYLAPEVWDGQPATTATDVYALGCVLYEMLTGQGIFARTNPSAIMRAHFEARTFPARWPPGVPDGVSAILNKALAREAVARFQRAGDFARALQPLLTVTRLAAVPAITKSTTHEQAPSLTRYEESPQASRASSEQPQTKTGKSSPVVLPQVLVQQDASTLLLNQPLHSLALGVHGSDLRLACGTAEGKVALWSVNEGRLIRILDGHTQPVLNVAISPDGTHCVSGGADGQVMAWNLDTGARPKHLNCPNHTVSAVAISPDSRAFAAVTCEGWLVGGLLNPTPGGEWRLNLDVPAACMSYRPRAGDLIITTTKGRTFSASPSRFAPFGHEKWPSPNCMAFSAEGKLLALGSRNGRVYLCPSDGVSSSFWLTGFSQPVTAVGFSPVRPLLASAYEKGGIALWLNPYRTGKGAEPSLMLRRHQAPVVGLAFAPYGEVLVSGSRDGEIRFWDVSAVRPPR